MPSCTPQGRNGRPAKDQAREWRHSPVPGHWHLSSHWDGADVSSLLCGVLAALFPEIASRPFVFLMCFPKSCPFPRQTYFFTEKYMSPCA